MERKSMITLETLIDVVREAAKLMVTDNFEVTQKDGFANIVTTSDVAVQTFLCDRLAQLLPGSGFYCEENDLWDVSNEYTWIIDPIDGTANYSRGIANCGISVALKHGADIELGVVYVPMTQELFSAQKGGGAFLNGKPIRVSDRLFENAILCTALPVYHKEYADLCSGIILDAFYACNDIRRFGACAPELCYVAMGRCELYFEYLLGLWDFAAATLILSEAGGTVSGLDGKPLSYTKGSGVVAANNAENHRRLMDIIGKRMDQSLNHRHNERI